MLDPISVLGVAAAAVQFIDFATKLLAVGKEVRESSQGTTNELIHLDEVFSDLKKISLELSKHTTPASSILPEPRDLCTLAASCYDECNQFMAAIGKLSNNSTSKRTFKSLRQALSIVWSKSSIEALEKRLERYQREITLALITNISNGQSAISLSLSKLMAENRQQTKDIGKLVSNIRKYEISRSLQTPDPVLESLFR